MQVWRMVGPPQIFLHAVGRNVRKPVLELADGDWEDTLTLNLSSAYWLGQAVGRLMVEQGYGRMVFVSSVSGLLAHAPGRSVLRLYLAETTGGTLGPKLAVGARRLTASGPVTLTINRRGRAALRRGRSWWARRRSGILSARTRSRRCTR